ncbi:MAG: tRNA epoxyqueuosine(34) reductase QueG [Anaerolineaceae bacterium]
MLRNGDIKNEAHALGFTISGIALPAQPRTYPQYDSWLQAGRQAGMAYLAAERARQRRADARLILPEVRSLISLGIRYPHPSSAPQPVHPGDHTGRIAAYAWGDDYHHVIPPRLAALHQRIERIAGHAIAWRGYTDTGPILERDLAQQAGLGWIGKNTCLINPQQGSYFLLAEMLLDLELEPDEPLRTDHCGSCTRCIDACPTACILPDRTIDAGRCISYLTIENKGSIPRELRPQMGDWVFGCDICQIVCPWNVRFAPSESEPAFLPLPGIPQPNLVEELQLSSHDFHRKFVNSPVQRAKRRGYLRNVAVALGNTADAQTLPVLQQSMEREIEPLVRAHVAWAIGRINTRRARNILARALKKEAELAVRAEIEGALERAP